jgi:molybdenum cofactor cytidylyltransferase
MKFAAVVLAAGRSTRMGANKLLADLSGRPLLATTIKQIQDSGVDKTVVVAGHQAQAVATALSHTKVVIIHNAQYANGLSTSVRCGIAAVQDFDAAFICLGDMPLIRFADMQRLMQAFNVDEGRRLIAPTYHGQLGNPVLWGQEYFKALMELEGDRGARSLLEASRQQITEIAVEHDGILLDADTPEALAEMRKREDN